MQPGEGCDLGVDNSNIGACTLGVQAARVRRHVRPAAGLEECDDGNQSNTRRACGSCKAAECGDGFVQQGVEQCDDGNEVNTDALPQHLQDGACGDGVDPGRRRAVRRRQPRQHRRLHAACKPAKCGDGFVQAGVEQCDDGNLVSNDGCSATCQPEGCVLNPMVMNLPATLHAGNFYGEIAFDASCNVLAVTAFSGGLVRVNKNTGAVTTLVANFGGVGSANGVVFRPTDNRIYVATDNPSRLYSTDGVNPPVLHVTYPSTVNAIALAPAGFPAIATQIVGVTTAGTVVAVNPANNVITTVGTSSGILSDLVFSPAGTTLYIANQANNRIDAMTPAGVFSQLIGGLSEPDGLGVDLDGSRLFVAQYSGDQRIDRVSLPGGVLTAGPVVALDGGYYTTGIVVDAADNVFYKTQTGANATLASFKAP